MRAELARPGTDLTGCTKGKAFRPFLSAKRAWCLPLQVEEKRHANRQAHDGNASKPKPMEQRQADWSEAAAQGKACLVDSNQVADRGSDTRPGSVQLSH